MPDDLERLLSNGAVSNRVAAKRGLRKMPSTAKSSAPTQLPVAAMPEVRSAPYFPPAPWLNMAPVPRGPQESPYYPPVTTLGIRG